MSRIRLPLMIHDHDGGYYHKYDSGPLEWRELIENELPELINISKETLSQSFHCQTLSIGYCISIGIRSKTLFLKVKLKILKIFSKKV